METANVADDDDVASTSSEEEEDEESTKKSSASTQDEEEEDDDDEKETNKNYYSDAPAAAAAAGGTLAATAADDADDENGGIKICKALAKVKTDDDLAKLLKCKVEALAFVTLVEPLTKCRKEKCPYPAAKCNYSYCVLCADMWYPRIRYNNSNVVTKKERGHLLLGQQFSRGSVKQKSYCACGSDLCIGIGYTDALFSFPNNKSVLEYWLQALEAANSILLPQLKQKIQAKPYSYRIAYWHFDPQHLKLIQDDNDDDNGNKSSLSSKWELLRAESYTDASGKVWNNCPKYPPPNYDLQKFIASARASQETDLEERRMEGELPGGDWVRVMLRAETHPKLLYDIPTSAATAIAAAASLTTTSSRRKAASSSSVAERFEDTVSRVGMTTTINKKRKSQIGGGGGVIVRDHVMLVKALEKEVKRLERQVYDCKTEKVKLEIQHATKVQELEDKNNTLVHDNEVLSERVQEQALELTHLNSLLATWLPASLRPEHLHQQQQQQQQQRNHHHHHRSLR